VRPALDVRPGRGVAASAVVLSCLLFGCSSGRPMQAFPALEPVPSRPLPLPDKHARPGDVQLEVADSWSHLEGLWTVYAKLLVNDLASFRVNLVIRRNGPSFVQMPDLGCQAKLELFQTGPKTIRGNGSSFLLPKALCFAVGEGGKGKGLGDFIVVSGSATNAQGKTWSTAPRSSHSACKKNNNIVLGISDEGEMVYYELGPDNTPVAIGALQRAREATH
jgi:hypothetical protein